MSPGESRHLNMLTCIFAKYSPRVPLEDLQQSNVRSRVSLSGRNAQGPRNRAHPRRSPKEGVQLKDASGRIRVTTRRGNESLQIFSVDSSGTRPKCKAKGALPSLLSSAKLA